MLSGGAAAVRPRRSRWRSYLLLARVSNLPTVWTNVLAGIAAEVAVPPLGTLFQVCLSASLFYTGGMFLNDSFDLPFDSKARPERPIPSGDIPRAEGFIAGAVFLMAGAALLLLLHPRALGLGLALAVAILLYDRWHKGNPVAPLVMGACRGLVYCIAAAAVGGPSALALAGAGAITVYVIALTVVAKLSGPAAGWRVPLLLAGISLVDAVFIGLTTASVPLALLAACGFPLTLAMQRFVPGD